MVPVQLGDVKFTRRIGPEEKEEKLGGDGEQLGEPRVREGVGRECLAGVISPGALFCGPGPPSPPPAVQSRDTGLAGDASHRASPKRRERNMKGGGDRARPAASAAVRRDSADTPPRPRPGASLRLPRPSLPPLRGFLPRLAATAAAAGRGLAAEGAGPGRWRRRREPAPRRAPPPCPPAAAAPPPLCGGRCCPGDGAAPPRPRPSAASAPGSPRGRPPSRSPQEPPPQPAAGRDSGAVAGGAARLSAPVLSPAPLLAASVRWPGPAHQLALWLRTQAPGPPQGPAHQTVPGPPVPLWTLQLMTPGRRLLWKGMVPKRW